MGRARGGQNVDSARRRGSAAVSTGATAVLDAPVSGPVSWDQPAGPEATWEELLAWQQAHRPHWGEEAQARLEGVLDEAYENPHFPPRRSLEAALAAVHGVALDKFKSAHADRSWTELMEMAKAWDDANDGSRYFSLLGHNGLATDTEAQYRRWTAATGEALTDLYGPLPMPTRHARPSWRPDPDNVDIIEQMAKATPGLRSGRLEDYTRAEMRKLLGFQERDCKHLTDEDLRGMCLDGHLVPRWKGAMSHSELAARLASLFDWRSQKRQYQAALRMPYGALVAKAYNTDGFTDDGQLTDKELLANLDTINPFMARSGALSGSSYRQRALRDITTAAGLPLTLPDELKHTVSADAAQTLMTSLEMSYKPAFDGFVEQFGGARKLGQIHSGLKSKNSLTASPRNCVAWYDPATGDIYISNGFSKSLRTGEMTLATVEETVSTVAHELFHAMEGRDEGSRYTGTRHKNSAEHTNDEGGTEALARLHTQDLAQRMGVWNTEQGDLRAHAESGSYNAEVETMVALSAACVGELDLDTLRSGGYRQPEALSAEGRQYLLDQHLQLGPAGRMRRAAQQLMRSAGTPSDDERACRRYEEAVRQLLKECKSSRYQQRSKRVPLLDERGQQVLTEWGAPRTKKEWVEPQDLSANLAEMFASLGVSRANVAEPAVAQA